MQNFGLCISWFGLKNPNHDLYISNHEIEFFLNDEHFGVKRRNISLLFLSIYFYKRRKKKTDAKKDDYGIFLSENHRNQ